MANSGHPHNGLKAVFIAHRDTILRFLRARGAGDDAEDVLQDVWLKIDRAQQMPVGTPLAYLYRAANSVMIDRYRSRRQSSVREAAWAESQTGGDFAAGGAVSVERIVTGQDFARKVEDTLSTLPERTAAIFRRSRVDGIQQRVIAEEFGVSISTVESDLRAAYRALSDLKEHWNED